MEIESLDQYRAALHEAQSLEKAEPDTAKFRRREELLAAVNSYEQRHQGTDRTPGHPSYTSRHG